MDINDVSKIVMGAVTGVGITKVIQKRKEISHKKKKLLSYLDFVDNPENYIVEAFIENEEIIIKLKKKES